jgi:hypothetical protein
MKRILGFLRFIREAQIRGLRFTIDLATLEAAAQCELFA